MGGQIILMRSGGPAAKSPLGQRPQPDKRWIRMNDDIRRDGRQIRSKPALCLKAIPEFRMGQIVDNSRHDAARDVYSTARSNRERNISSDGSQHRTEHVQRGNAHLASSGGGGLRDLGRGSIWNCHFIKDPNRTVQILEPTARQDAFRLYVSISIAKMIYDRVLTARSSR